MKINFKVPLDDNSCHILENAIEDYITKRPRDFSRSHGWNSPSSLGGCKRLRYFQRKKMKPDYANPSGRLQRIFDNGTAVHERLQRYLLRHSILLLDEAPLYNPIYNILGTTDGLLLVDNSIVVLEIKSINSYGFKLNKPLQKHLEQASIYLYCLNYIRERILKGEQEQLIEEYSNLTKSYLSVKSAEKRIERFIKALDIIKKYPRKITDIIFLYENKDNQMLKEFKVSNFKDELKIAIKDIEDMNEYMKKNIVPPKEKGINCNQCNFRDTCKKFD